MSCSKYSAYTALSDASDVLLWNGQQGLSPQDVYRRDWNIKDGKYQKINNK
jgi:hypothetical protein